MATKINPKFAQSDVDISELMRDVRAMPADGDLPMGRRTFVKLAGAGAAGLVLAFHLPGEAFAAANAPQGGKDQSINAFIRIAPDNTITIYSKSPEIGQGIKTSLALIIAEELDADWDQVLVEQADFNPKVYGYQGAGGSTTIPRAWDQVRQAGAGAKAMLIAAAAKQWNVAPSEITAKDSTLTHAASGKTASYGSLAIAAAKMPVPDPMALTLKKRSEYRLLGRRHRGVDDPKVVSGKPLFGIDVQLPDMVYANYTKCPAAGGKVRSANLDEIKALPGVIDAFVVEGNGKPSEVMPGVAIVGKDTWAVFQAKGKLKIDWDESEASTDSTTEFSARAKKLAAAFPAKHDTDVGNVDNAFAQSAKTVEAYYEYPFAAHAPMEPMNTTAHWHDGIIEIWTPTQQPNRALPSLAALAGVKEDKVVIHQTRVGGGFGRRLVNDYGCEAAAIALKLNRPVKLQWTREDDFSHDFYRPAGYHQFKGAIDKNGKLDAWQEHFITFTADGKGPASGANYTENLKYSTIAPNLRRTSTLMPLVIPTGAWRAPGDNAQVFAVQSFMHELSLAAGRDHVAFLVNAVNRQVPELAPKDKNVNFSPARATGVIKLCAEKAGWGKPLPKGTGLGIAWCYSHAGHVAQAVELSVDANKRITVHRIVVAVDVGPIVDIAGAEAQAQGASTDAFSTAMGLQINIEHGRIQQQNYNDYPTLRMPFAPRLIEAYFIQSDFPPTGMGEPAFPAFAPALGNAVFAATGERVRSLPLRNLGYSV
ncbi:MAG TPA: molybdopterin cofactor-binding domain-containing protein [Micropepsaceae bacterium]|nr:molybdopterin cofactor-binding domain-containing protein [Micropepsaceae bacterium]